MGHGHGHGEPYTVPDACIYKVEDVPQLKQVQEALKRQGLKDPWLRNEVWRYNTKAFGTKGQRLRNALIPGFFYGLGLTALSIGAEYLLGKDNDHHHHDQSEKSEDH